MGATRLKDGKDRDEDDQGKCGVSLKERQPNTELRRHLRNWGCDEKIKT